MRSLFFSLDDESVCVDTVSNIIVFLLVARFKVRKSVFFSKNNIEKATQNVLNFVNVVFLKGGHVQRLVQSRTSRRGGPAILDGLKICSRIQKIFMNLNNIFDFKK